VWGSINYFVNYRVSLVGSSSRFCLCFSCRACLVPNTWSTFAVAAEMPLVIIGSEAVARVVFFCAVSAYLCLSARHCNMAVGPALVALGHISATMYLLAIFWLVVVYKPFRKQSVG
jgi:hypothetical protein